MYIKTCEWNTRVRVIHSFLNFWGWKLFCYLHICTLKTFSSLWFHTENVICEKVDDARKKLKKKQEKQYFGDEFTFSSLCVFTLPFFNSILNNRQSVTVISAEKGLLLFPVATLLWQILQIIRMKTHVSQSLLHNGWRPVGIFQWVLRNFSEQFIARRLQTTASVFPTQMKGVVRNPANI